MRIFFLTPQYAPVIGGLETLALHTTTELRARGHDVLTVCSGEAQPDDEPWLRRLPMWSALNEKNPAAILECTTTLKQVLREFAPDIIHSQFSGYTAYFAQIAARRAPLVMALFDLETGGDLQRRSLRDCAWLLAGSHAVRDRAVRLVPGLETRSEVLYPGLAAGPEQASAEDTLRLLAMGRMVQSKGFDVLLHAFARMAGEFPAARLCMLGDGPALPEWQELAHSLDLGERVEWLGRCSEAEKFSQIARARCVVMPSRDEGFGLVAVEAASQAKPVVAARVGGLAEQVVHEETGLLVPPEDPDSLAEALTSLLRNQAHAQNLGRNAQRRALSAFSAQHYTDKVLETYRKVLAG